MAQAHALIENVSRRGFLKGLLATGGLVVAAEFAPTRAGWAAYATGAAKMPGESSATRTSSSQLTRAGS